VEVNRRDFCKTVLASPALLLSTNSKRPHELFRKVHIKAGALPEFNIGNREFLKGYFLDKDKSTCCIIPCSSSVVVPKITVYEKTQEEVLYKLDSLATKILNRLGFKQDEYDLIMPVSLPIQDWNMICNGKIVDKWWFGMVGFLAMKIDPNPPYYAHVIPNCKKVPNKAVILC
jgi:hypothetical protein